MFRFQHRLQFLHSFGVQRFHFVRRRNFLESIEARKKFGIGRIVGGRRGIHSFEFRRREDHAVRVQEAFAESPRCQLIFLCLCRWKNLNRKKGKHVITMSYKNVTKAMRALPTLLTTSSERVSRTSTNLKALQCNLPFFQGILHQLLPRHFPMLSRLSTETTTTRALRGTILGGIF